ncbi:MAG: GNAT family N-acetyltransferase [Neomegalonema sp.]
MLPLHTPFRVARAGDAQVLAELVNYAGEGLPEYLWGQLASPGEDAWAIGVERQVQKIEEGQIVVVDEGAGAISALTGYAIGADPQPIDDDPPDIVRPLIELENLAPNAGYVNVLATLPDHRGKGWGRKLLDVAEKIAAAQDLKDMSIIVADTNEDAWRLYTRVGYQEAARRPIVKTGWVSSGREWVLLIKGSSG